MVATSNTPTGTHAACVMSSSKALLGIPYTARAGSLGGYRLTLSHVIVLREGTAGANFEGLEQTRAAPLHVGATPLHARLHTRT